MVAPGDKNRAVPVEASDDSPTIVEAPTIVQLAPQDRVITQVVRMRKRALSDWEGAVTHAREMGESWGQLVAPVMSAMPQALAGRSMLAEVMTTETPDLSALTRDLVEPKSAPVAEVVVTPVDPAELPDDDEPLMIDPDDVILIEVA